MVTTFLSERRVPGGREFLFASSDPQPDRDARPSRALQTARAFSWGDDAAAANDPLVAPDEPAAAGEDDYAQFLKALRGVYRAPRRIR